MRSANIGCMYYRNEWKIITLSLENMSFFGSGISGSLTEEMLLDESFLLVFKALLSSECLGTSVMWYKILTFSNLFTKSNKSYHQAQLKINVTVVKIKIVGKQYCP